MNQFKNTDISSKEAEDVINSMNKEDLDILSKRVDDGSSDSDSDVESDNSSEIAKHLGSEIMKDFRQNMNILFDDIVKKAEKLKKDAEAKRIKQEEKK